MNVNTKDYGPLANLIGIWEGDKGVDIAPSDDRGTEKNLFRERMEFVPMDDVHNHEQQLKALRYKTTIWPAGSPNPFHEELGYWLWDAKRGEVLRCFLVPRGVSIIAGGKAQALDTSFLMEANSGDCTHGICANKFLDEEFKTIKYTCKVTCDGATLQYEQHTFLRMKGREDIFDHADSNTLTKIS